jgi:outer membrane protein
MIKKVVLFALLIAPAIGFSQEKIAYVNYQEILPLMPEYEVMRDSLENEKANFEEEIRIDQEEFNKKYAEFVEKQATLTDNLKEKRMAELQDMRSRVENFQIQAQAKLQELQQNMLEAIIEKINKVLEEISVQHNFAYVIDASALHYYSPKSTNVTPLIKAKLGLKDLPVIPVK